MTYELRERFAVSGCTVDLDIITPTDMHSHVKKKVFTVP